ncbi:MAG: nucleotidyltransferase domain-containing protein [Campylobacterota bacterium]|nr:nucleotidyltransferase domain-containing protein [Campylobacterota bacterium]
MNIQKVLQKHKEIVFTLLFGSFARNSSNVLSDVDIAIFTDRTLDILEFGMLVSDLEQECQRKVDLVILNDLYKTDARLAFNIINAHQIIFCNDKDAYIDFKSDTMQYYFDIEPMYEMFDKQLLKRLDNGTYGEV